MNARTTGVKKIWAGLLAAITASMVMAVSASAAAGDVKMKIGLAGELQLNSGDGQTVPPIGRGSSVVITDQNGATILAGTF